LAHPHLPSRILAGDELHHAPEALVGEEGLAGVVAPLELLVGEGGVDGVVAVAAEGGRHLAAAALGHEGVVGGVGVGPLAEGAGLDRGGARHPATLPACVGDGARPARAAAHPSGPWTPCVIASTTGSGSCATSPWPACPR